MKIYTRAAAVVLAFVMICTAGGFNGLRAKAGNLTDSERGDWDYGFEITPGSEDVSYLDEAFDLYQYQWVDRANPTMGKEALKPSDSDWGFTTKGGHGNNARGGLKPVAVYPYNNSGYALLTYKKEVEHFEAEYTFYTNAVMGLTFGGAKGTFPISQDGDSSNDTAVAVYMEQDGKLFVYGAIDSSSAAAAEGIGITKDVTGGYGGWMENTSNVVATNMTEGVTVNMDQEITASTGTFTICVRVQGNELTVYEKSHESKKLTVNLSEQYQRGPVSLFHTNIDQGAFKSFRIKEIDPPHQPDYDFTGDMAALENAFTSYHMDKAAGTVENGTVEGQWFRWLDSNANGPDGGIYEGYYRNTNCLKPKHKNSKDASDQPTKYTLLTLKDTPVENFAASVEYLINFTGYGMMVAPAGELADPLNGISVYVNAEGRIMVSGAIDASSAAWSGQEALDSPKYNNSLAGPAHGTYKVPMGNWDSYAQNQTSYRLNVKIENGELTASVDGFPGELSVKLTGNYEGGVFSLYSVGYDQGGFKNLDFAALSADAPAGIQATAKWQQDGEYVTVALSSDRAYSKLKGSVSFPAGKYDYVGQALPESGMYDNLGREATAAGGKLTFEVAGNKAGELVTFIFRPATPGVWSAADFTWNMNASQSAAVRGDANGDQQVDVRDLVRLKRYEADSSVPIMAANATLSGALTEAANFTALRRALASVAETPVSPLAGKSALFLGDSIGYGALDNIPGYSWGGRIGTLCGAKTRTVAQSGWMLATHTGRSAIVGQLDHVSAEEGKTYDYVILHGGVNDIWHSTDNPTDVVPLGAVTPENQTSGFDTSTTCGALEDLIVKARAKAPNAKIAFIINFDISGKIGDMSAFVEAAKSVCDKWDVPYLDLYGNEELKQEFNNSVHLSDGVHPNGAGYDILARYVRTWMEGL